MTKDEAQIVFKPGLVADDGRCLSWLYEVYLGTTGWAKEGPVFHTKELAVEWCAKNGRKVISA